MFKTILNSLAHDIRTASTKRDGTAVARLEVIENTLSAMATRNEKLSGHRWQAIDKLLKTVRAHRKFAPIHDAAARREIDGAEYARQLAELRRDVA